MYNNATPPLTMGANVLPQHQMSCGYAAPFFGVHDRGCDSFIIIVVLFILLIIIGAAFCG